jgi:hypothetical protein
MYFCGLFWIPYIVRDPNIFLKTSQVFGLSPRCGNTESGVKINLPFGFRLSMSKSEHLTLKKKNSTSDSNTTLTGIAIRSTIFHTNFSAKKML